jgi:formate hydrogenlyase subunit 6/NADH:ubiquinone oxidoreductase subunit I
MGIDVRAYAMANTDVKRAACVGCGMCAHVCARGVLKLEATTDRFKGGTPIRVYAVDL